MLTDDFKNKVFDELTDKKIILFLENEMKEEKNIYQHIFKNRFKMMNFILENINKVGFFKYESDDNKKDVFYYKKKYLFSYFANLFFSYAEENKLSFFDENNFENCLVLYNNKQYIFSVIHGQGSIYFIQPILNFSNIYKKNNQIIFEKIFSPLIK